MKRIAVYFGEKSISGEKVAGALLGFKMPFSMVTAEEIASGELERYGGVIFPGGHSIRMGEKATGDNRMSCCALAMWQTPRAGYSSAQRDIA